MGITSSSTPKSLSFTIPYSLFIRYRQSILYLYQRGLAVSVAKSVRNRSYCPTSYSLSVFQHYRVLIVVLLHISLLSFFSCSCSLYHQYILYTNGCIGLLVLPTSRLLFSLFQTFSFTHLSLSTFSVAVRLCSRLPTHYYA